MLAPARWDWQSVRRVLVVRLRSIGDTVLATPALYALRRFLPRARIDVLLESWVAPVLDGYEGIDSAEGHSLAPVLRANSGWRAMTLRLIFTVEQLRRFL